MNYPELNPDFEALLDYIKLNRGFDFTGYKRLSLMRRVGIRMQLAQIETYRDYTDYLEDVLKVKTSQKLCQSSDHNTNHGNIDKCL